MAKVTRVEVAAKAGRTYWALAEDAIRCGVAAVSFDFFDTLVKRQVETPVVAFELVHQRLIDEGFLLPLVSAQQFRRRRVEAERCAREQAKQCRGSYEVSLGEIYEQLKGTGAIQDSLRCAEMELDVEVSIVYANPWVSKLLHRCREIGCRVVVTSDTYFSDRDLRRMLRKAYPRELAATVGARDIFVSSKYGVGKANGLFERMLAATHLDAGDVIHIGDNYHADVEGASATGIRAFHLPNGTSELWEVMASERGLIPYSVSGTRGFDSHARLIINGSLSSLRTAATLAAPGGESAGYEHFGATVLGPLLAFFVIWCDRVAGVDPRTRFCGMLREGGFLVGLLKRAFPNRSTATLAVSRLTVAKAALTEVSRRTLLELVPHRHAICGSELLERLGLAPGDVPDKFVGLSYSRVSTAHVDQFLDFILGDPALCAKVASFGTAFFRRMRKHVLSAMGFGASSAFSVPVVLLDLGWAGTIQKRLIELFGLEPSMVRGAYLALNERGIENALSGMAIGGAVFDGCEGFMHSSIALRFVEVLEQCTTPDSGSVVDYRDDGSPLFGQDTIPRNQREQVQRVQAGVLAFFDTLKLVPQAVVDSAFSDVASFQAMFSRLAFAPQPFERSLFAKWVHDDSFANGEVEQLTPIHHDAVSRYLTPRQVLSASFGDCYWPFGPAGDLEFTETLSQCVASLKVPDVGRLFERDVNISLEVYSRIGGVESLVDSAPIVCNSHLRACADFAGLTGSGEALVLRALGPGADRWLVSADIAMFFSTPADTRAAVSETVSLDATVGGSVAGSLSEGGLFVLLPPSIVATGSVFSLRVGLSLRERRPFGLAVESEDLAAANHEFGPERVRSCIDLAFGFPWPLKSESLCEMSSDSVSFAGWAFDTLNGRAPRRVDLLVERGNGQVDEYPCTLVARGDVAHALQRPIVGRCGWKVAVPLLSCSGSAFRFGIRASFIDGFATTWVGQAFQGEILDNGSLVVKSLSPSFSAAGFVQKLRRAAHRAVNIRRR